MRRAWAAAFLLVTLLGASAATACPYCVGSTPVLPTSLKLVGLFLLVPFVVFGVVAGVARRLR